MAAEKVRVRFAPSPTGHLHVGNARTALFNWLFARRHGGTFILRIEDTDLERQVEGAEQKIYDDLRWLGLDWDEGPDLGGSHAPYRQSERLDLYREHAERLLAERKAYLCFCSAEELERDRQLAMAEHRPPHYSGKCRALDPAEAARRRSSGEAAAIRLHIPEHPIRFHDLVRGEVEFSHEVVSDPIILRSSGLPVYNYVVVIDDAVMEITHVIRGDDHLSNTPKQVALYEALGWPVPEFAHLSTILGGDRERLSKRHGATSVENFRSMGVLPEALVNHMALLGWAPSGGDREVFSRDELVREFSLERVTPSPAVFDMEKLAWLNRHYIKQRFVVHADRTIDVSHVTPQELGLTEEQFRRLTRLAQWAAANERLALAALSWPYFVGTGYLPRFEDGADKATVDWFIRVIDLLSPSVDRLEQLPDRARVIFQYDARAAEQTLENAHVFNWNKTREVIRFFAEGVVRETSSDKGELTVERFKALVAEVKARINVKAKELFHPIRIALIGFHSGPEFDRLIPLIEVASTLPLPRQVPSLRQRARQCLDQDGFAKYFAPCPNCRPAATYLLFPIDPPNLLKPLPFSHLCPVCGASVKVERLWWGAVPSAENSSSWTLTRPKTFAD